MSKRTAAAGSSKPKANNRVKKTAKGYKFPEHIPTGHIITDTKKQEWCIHETIGTGGFGEIYSATAVGDSSKHKSNLYAIKIEPKDNGPLYVEMHFYMRVGKADEIEKWKKKKGLKSFGMPVLHGSGSFEYKSNNYRFLVTDRLGRNLQDILNENNKQLPHVTVLQIGIQVLNIIEYIHSREYIHGDIKAGNMMLGLQSGSENTVYVIDFGLACKCSPTSKEFNKDPKKAHNGTIEYISRDGHTGVFGFRGDLEILGYNLIHWLTGTLPWENDLSNSSVVEQKKIDMMKNPTVYFKKNMPGVSEEIVKYMEYIGSLNNNDIPDYEYCRKLLSDKLADLKCSSPYGKLTFTTNKSTKSSPTKNKVNPKAKVVAKKKPATPLSSPIRTKSPRAGRKRKSPEINKNDQEEENVAEEEEMEEEEVVKEVVKKIAKRGGRGGAKKINKNDQEKENVAEEEEMEEEEIVKEEVKKIAKRGGREGAKKLKNTK